MRVEGRWYLFDDGVVRPVIDAFVQRPDGEWEGIVMLLDSGADRTVFDAGLLELLTPLALADAPQLSGVGGKVAALLVQTRLGLTRDDGNLVSISGAFGLFTDLKSSDVSVPGRDVTDNFDVIYSYPSREVLLLASPHGYGVQRLS